MNEEQSFTELHSLGVIYNALKKAEEHGLLAEVVYSALIYQKNNPNVSISYSILVGLEEWVK